MKTGFYAGRLVGPSTVFIQLPVSLYCRYFGTKPNPLLPTDPKDTMFFTTIALYQSITTQTQLRTLSNIDLGAKPKGQYFLVFSAWPGLGLDIIPKLFSSL